jgi:RecJ-like exonuclease
LFLKDTKIFKSCNMVLNMSIILFKDVKREDVGKTYEFKGRIEIVKQTSGPTLMILNDGSSNFTFKAFLKAGERAYPECDIGDYVYIKAQINERNNDIEGEVRIMTKLREDEINELREKIEEMKNEKLKPRCDNFSIESKVLEALKPRFIKIATMIKRAILDGRPILLRHDADCDGYASAICMERAIIKFMDEVSGGDKQLQFQNYRRAPSRAPFYEYEDAVKDAAHYLRDKNRNSSLPPLIIITDNGSTEEDIFGMTQMKLYDAQIVVIDHHFPGEIKNGRAIIDDYIDGHLNPYLEGFDSNVCSGMLGYEMARFIYEENNNSIMIPAMAGILDHTEGKEKEEYIKKAIEEGYSIDYMEKLGEIVYLQSHYLRFQEAREFVDDLFGANKKVQEKLVELLSPEIKRRFEKVKNIARHYSVIEDFGNFYLVNFDGEKGTSRGEFPAVGKSTNQVHKMFEDELDKPVITITSGSTFLTIRVSDSIKEFSVPYFCTNWIDKKIPFTGAEGGGHEKAGSIKFVEYAREEIITLFKKYLKEISKNQ